ncbi:MAG: shikimate kinase AroL [Desulfopila sp.]|jgi:shikimate kinase|nr:shikimate kinase AroL [Desulfopila sp.]
MHNLIILIGYRGVGKTTVGRRLADTLGYDFCDTDKAIVQLKNKEITEIVQEEGWDRFRKLEKKILQSLGKLRQTVVATGGGAVLHQSEWENLRKEGIVFWLTADKNILLERIRRDSSTKGQRPSLTGADVMAETEQVLRLRAPLYASTAHHQIDTGRNDVEESVRKIQRLCVAAN